jgi:pathogenesis-related protein 1
MSLRTFLALALIALPLSAQQQQAITATNSHVNLQDAQQALDLQNAKRHDVGVPPLTWSTDLAAVAQKWADHLAADQACDLVHTQGGPYGENLFGGSGRVFTAVDAVNDWYSEISKFHYAPLADNTWFDSGHYTQMIWRNTTKVGMGRATCPSGRVVIVAEYDPPGNYMGQKPY